MQACVLWQRVSRPLVQTGNPFMGRNGEEEEGLFRTSSRAWDEEWTEKQSPTRSAFLPQVLSVIPAPAASRTKTRSWCISALVLGCGSVRRVGRQLMIKWSAVQNLAPTIQIFNMSLGITLNTKLFPMGLAALWMAGVWVGMGEWEAISVRSISHQRFSAFTSFTEGKSDIWNVLRNSDSSSQLISGGTGLTAIHPFIFNTRVFLQSATRGSAGVCTHTHTYT